MPLGPDRGGHPPQKQPPRRREPCADCVVREEAWQLNASPGARAGRPAKGKGRRTASRSAEDPPPPPRPTWPGWPTLLVVIWMASLFAVGVVTTALCILVRHFRAQHPASPSALAPRSLPPSPASPTAPPAEPLRPLVSAPPARSGRQRLPCPRCGTLNNPAKSTYCRGCGAHLEPATPATAKR